jgi:hypothetical protein
MTCGIWLLGLVVDYSNGTIYELRPDEIFLTLSPNATPTPEPEPAPAPKPEPKPIAAPVTSCPRCQKQTTPGDKFCEFCGEPLR